MSEQENHIDIIVTGATGFIGRWLLVECTRRKMRVLALGRKMASRGPELAQWVTDRGGRGELLQFGALDLMLPGLGLTVDSERALQRAKIVYHTAARFAFGLEREEAYQANVQASLALLSLCAKSTTSQRFVFLSGYRAEGATYRSLDITDTKTLERLYRSCGAYEASKIEAHHRMQAAATQLGVEMTTVCPASVLGAYDTGETSQLQGLAETMRDLWYGRVPVIPGARDTWCPVTFVDVLARVLIESGLDPVCAGEVIVVLNEDTPTLPHLIALAAHEMDVKSPRRLVSTSVIGALPASWTGVDPESLSFLSNDRYDTRAYKALCQRANINAPTFPEGFVRWLDYLVQTSFLEHEPRQWRRHQRGGVTISAHGDGAQARAVLLHGIFLDGQSWSKVRQMLPVDSVAFDLPGVGASTSAIHSEAAWMDAAMSQGRSMPVTLVGHSLGTAYALDYASRHPDRVSHLVLVSPYFLQAQRRYLACQWLTQMIFRGVSTSTLVQDLAPFVNTHERAQRLLGRPVVLKQQARLLSRALQHASAYRELLSEIDVPTSIVVGEHDPLIHEPPAGVSVYVMKGQGHYPQLGAPEAVADVIYSSFDGVSGA